MKVAIIGHGLTSDIMWKLAQAWEISAICSDELAIPDEPYIDEEFIEATPYVAIYTPTILVQIAWAAALRQFYRR